MPQIEWSKDLETGNELVDNQHKGLFNLLNDLSTSIYEKKSKKVLKESIEKLTLYVVEHFSAEESFMLKEKYPAFAEHKKIHEDLFIETATIIEAYRNTDDHRMAIPIVVFLTKWITNHIQKEDKKFFDWVREGALK